MKDILKGAFTMNKKQMILEIVLWAVKLLLLASILFPLIFFSYRMVEGRLSDLANAGDPHYHSGMGLYLFASHAVLFFWNICNSVAAGIGWLLTSKFYRKERVWFKILTFAPVVSQVLYLVGNLILLNLLY